MLRILMTLAVSSLLVTSVATAEEGGTSYYVQLVRGTDADHSPQAGSQRIGPKLARRFQEVFKWKNYWEICQRKIEVVPGRTGKISLINGREVHIDLTKPGKRTVTTFQNGKLVERATGPADESMTLIGGVGDQASVWFVVVRRDKPGS